MANAITESRLLIGGLLSPSSCSRSRRRSSSCARCRARSTTSCRRRAGSARGDLGERVPVQGDDEFAALGQEFNTMAEQLETHIEEVERKRRELEDSIRRIGEAFGTGLDRQGLVDLAVRTAIEACDAEAGRLVPVDPRELEEVRLVDDPGLLQALEAAERQVLAPGTHAPSPAHGRAGRRPRARDAARRPPRRRGRGRDARRDLDRAPRRATSRSSSATCSPT